MKKASARSILVAMMLLAVGVTVEAQQPKKVARIGIFRRKTQLVSPTVLRQFGWLCASVAT